MKPHRRRIAAEHHEQHSRAFQQPAYDISALRPLVDELTIDHDPRALLGEFVLRGYAECQRRGVRLSFAPIEILTEINHTQDTLMIADKILRVFKIPQVIAGNRLDVTTSIGISVYPDHGDDAETLVKNAELAMHQVKKADKNDYRFYAVDDA